MAISFDEPLDDITKDNRKKTKKKSQKESTTSKNDANSDVTTLVSSNVNNNCGSEAPFMSRVIFDTECIEDEEMLARLEVELAGEMTKPFPHWSKWIMYAGMLVTSVLCLVLCVFLGKDLDSDAVLLWMCTLTIGLLIHLLFFEPLKVIGLTLINTKIDKKWKDAMKSFFE